MIIRGFEPGMDIGVGYDSLSGLVRGDCVIRTEPERPKGGEGQEIIFQYQQVTTTLELAKYLDISASGVINAQWFTKGSGKAHFLFQTGINRYSVYLLLKVVVKNPALRMRDVKLTDEAWELLSTQKAESFRQRCGDEFVVGLITGGEYFALVEVEASSEQQKRDISALIRSTAPAWEVGVEFENSMSKLSSSYSVKITSYQVGGKDTKVPKTVEDMIKRAINFSEQVKGEYAQPYQALFLDYKALNLPRRANLIDINNQKMVIAHLWDLRLKHIGTLYDIEYVSQNPHQFESFSHEELNVKANEIRGLINEITKSASKCANNYQSCDLPSNLIEPVVKLPQRKENWDKNNKAIQEGKQTNLLERLRIEIEALSKIGLEANFEEVKEGYGLVLPCTEDLTLVFWLSPEYPALPPKVLMRTSSESKDLYFAPDAWQPDNKIVEIVSKLLDSER